MDKHYRIPLTGPQIEQKLMEQSVPLQQGADNAGKVLTVGADGNVELTSVETLIKDKLPKFETATDEDAMDLLTELKIISPITTSTGNVYTSNTGEIYTL